MVIILLSILAGLLIVWLTLWAICVSRMIWKLCFHFDDVITMVERELNKNR